MYLESIVKTLLACLVIVAILLVYRISVHQWVNKAAEKLWFAWGVFLILSLVNLSFDTLVTLKNREIHTFIVIFFQLLWWLTLYYLVIQTIQYWFWDKLYVKPGVRFSRILHDSISILLFLLTLIAIIHFVFDRSVFGVFTASGVLVIILAYSAQVYLSDVFAGFELHNAKEFAVGDWLKVNDQVGKVVQMNWQYVKLVTRENNQLSFANSIISKAVVTNLSRPSPERAITLSIPLFDNTSPAKFKDCVLAAIAQSPQVLRSPAPVVSLQNLNKDCCNYQLTYYTQAMDESLVNSQILSLIWYMARRRQIKISTHELAVVSLPNVDDIKTFLHNTDLLASLNSEELTILASQVVGHDYGPPECVLEQGQSNSSLFLVYSGSVDIVLTDEVAEVFVATLKAGEYVGEMSFLTGEVCNASVFVKEESIILEINHDSIAEVLQRQPELIEKMSAVIASRKIQDKVLHEEAVRDHQVVSSDLIDRLVERIKHFFRIG